MIYNVAHKIELVPNKKQEEYFVKAYGVASSVCDNYHH